MAEQGAGPAETGTYLYAIGANTGVDAEPWAAAGRPAPDGVLGAPVRALAERAPADSELVAYVSTVPLTEFGEEALRRNLEDLAWLETVARAHHQVLTSLMEAGPMLPVRLVTVYRGDEHVRAMLRDRAAEFADLLVRMSGRKEWGVKVYAVGEGEPAQAAGAGRARARRAGAERAGAEQGGAGRAGAATERPGTAYLKRRSESLRGQEERRRRAMNRAEHIDSVLSRFAVATRHHRAQDPRLSGRADLMVLNGAYLVDDGLAGDFAAAAAELREDDLEVELTGPWPPYSFTISDSDDDATRVAGGGPT
ncbi:MAG TPA: GvpL/GvpF family gas vesicle protein [Streptosporangiaceae bacterium]|nr:GvpL/GvpF family gas vesicle protein [Streptosporangiaceae bacterium]